MASNVEVLCTFVPLHDLSDHLLHHCQRARYTRIQAVEEIFHFPQILQTLQHISHSDYYTFDSATENLRKY